MQEGSNFGRLEGKVDSIAAKLETLNTTVASMMPRAEVDSEIGRRVSLEVYTADQRATNERLLRLEGSPMKFLAWFAAGTGCLSVIMTAIAIMVGVIEYVVLHH